MPDAPPPPPKSGITCLIIGACGVGGGVLVVAVLAALLLPAIHKAKQRAQVTMCANNLKQLWTLQNIYTSQFGSRGKKFPEAKGAAFWLHLAKTTPPLVDPSMEQEIFLCPVRTPASTTGCDYLGPTRQVLELKDEEPVGADKPGNHTIDRKPGGNVLRKDGSIAEIFESEYKTLVESLSP